MILVQDLHQSYGQHLALDGLSLEIASGETIGLLGPNGAGKTTTIKMLVGLLTPDSGRVAIGVDDASRQTLCSGGPESDGWSKFDPKRPAVRKTIGIAPQSLSLYDELTGKENLAFFGGLYGLRGARLAERVQWGLSFSELDDRKNDPVGTYSGGMKRRLNIAVALVHQPEILLLDEPTVGVDPQSRNHIFESIQRLQKEGLTIIYTTHYMEEAQRLCDRVAIMDHGRLLDIGTVAELVDRHGGDSVITATLRRPAEGVDLPGSLEGLDWRLESDRPIDQISELTAQGVEFQTLQIAEPDLESIFLTLTGRSLRD